MIYVGILLATILISFLVVLIGGLALQLTGIEPDVARFQALSAFSGTGFTTRESERVVGHKTRRQIVTILIILGNAGLVTIIATLVASMAKTRDESYAWFFIRLATIIGGIIVLYSLILKTRIGNQIISWIRNPLMKRIMMEAPTIDEVYLAERDWSISLVMVKKPSKNIGLSLADITSEGDMVILAIDSDGNTITMPDSNEQIIEEDRLLVYGNKKSIKRLLVDNLPAISH